MKTKAVRIHGVDDLRLDEFELPDIKDDEILAKVISDSICMSSHKLSLQGDKHKRVRSPLATTPVIIGHEFCGELVEIGAKWRNQFKAGQRFAIQPALNYQGTLWAPGYSYQYIGGDATYIVIPREVMELGCLLEYKAEAFFMGSLAEPVSCIVGAYHAQYHTKGGSCVHEMGIKEGGSLALLASVGPMGIGAIDYAMHAHRRPARVVVTDIDDARLKRAASIFTVEEAKVCGVELIYVNTKDIADPIARLKELNGGKLFDDVFVFAPVKSVVEMGDRLLGSDGCLNFFAGPTDTSFSALLNFYDVHYESHHLVGTSGGNTDDIKESLEMMADDRLNPVAMITHVGGLDSVPATTIGLDKIPGGKKLIYTHKKLPLVALVDFEERGKAEPFYAELGRIVKRNNMLWCKEAEDYLLAQAPGDLKAMDSGNRFSAVIFDMDGVLVDSEAFIAEAAMAMLAESYGVVATREDFLPFVGMGEDRFIGGVAEKYGVALSSARDKARTYELYFEVIKGKLCEIPGAGAFAKECRVRGLKTAIATSADRRKLEANLREVGLRESDFDVLIDGLQVARKKPFPDIYLEAARRLGVESGSCLVVEDAVSGVKAAKAAGCTCLALAGSFSEAALRKAGADFFAPDLLAANRFLLA